METMKITYDPTKREKTLSERGLDFADAEGYSLARSSHLRMTGKNTENRVSLPLAILAEK
jgi:uncharacterized DUF497 family protein